MGCHRYINLLCISVLFSTNHSCGNCMARAEKEDFSETLKLRASVVTLSFRALNQLVCVRV